MKLVLLFVVVVLGVYAQSPSKLAYKELTDETFENATRKAAVLIFYNPWSSAYKRIITDVNRLAEKIGDQVTVGMIDVQRNKKLAKIFVLSDLPHVIIKKEDNIILQYDGPFDYDKVLDLLYREEIYKEKTPEVTLISMRGKSEESDCVRMLLNILEIQYKDQLLSNEEEWNQLKEKYTNEGHTIYYDTLPLLIYNQESYIQEQFSILKFIGKKYRLYGLNEVEITNFDQFIEYTTKVLNSYESISLHQGQGSETMIKSYVDKTLSSYLKISEKLVENSKNLHVNADSSNICDIILYYMLHINMKYIKVGEEDMLQWYPRLQKFVVRMEAIPALKKLISKRR